MPYWTVFEGRIERIYSWCVRCGARPLTAPQERKHHCAEIGGSG